MKSITPRTIFLCASYSSSSISPSPYFLSSHCLFYRSSHIKETQNKRGGTFFFSSSSIYPSSPSWRHDEEESRNVKVSVWWDFENCSIPTGVNVFRVGQRITSALRANEINGPVAITAFGDVSQLSRANQEALSSTGIHLNHIPCGGKNSADRSLLLDLLYWVSQNPPPAHLFLISGDRDFANILHRLRMNNYNILLASTESAPGVLYSAASIMWHWNALVSGDCLIGKVFNQPPDGPYGSWYGHYKGPLEDPFLDMGQPACSQPEDSPEPGTDSKPRPVPKALVNRIRQIVNSRPKGISIAELRSELGKCNVAMDKDFFGHKKFSRLLMSLPLVLKLRFAGDGQILVRGIQPKAVEPVESNLKSSIALETNKADRDCTVTAELNGWNSAMAADVIGKSPFTPVASQKPEESPPLGGNLIDAQTPLTPVAPRKPEESPPLGGNSIDASTTVGYSSHMEEHDSTSEVGLFRRIWRTWFGHKSGGCNEKSNNVPVKFSTIVDSSEKIKSEEKSVESRSHHPNPLGSSLFSSSDVNKSVLEEKTAMSSEENGNKSSPSTGFFNQIMNWCRFQRTSTNADNAGGQSGEEVNLINNQSENHEMFSKVSFWHEMESFVCTPEGLALVSQSRNRAEMSQKLRKEGPSVLNILSTSDILHLVDLLISEKKWVEECLSQTFPFKLTHPDRRWSSPSHLRGPNGLSSLFSGTSSQSKLQRLPDHEREKGDQNHSQTGSCSSKSDKQPSGKSRCEILTDCQKLVAEIMEEHPEGFNMSAFKKCFLERYGYALDYQMLGYQKLTTLLQSMPGVSIESTFILPSGKAAFDSSWDHDRDSAWEELGPISETSSDRNGKESGFDEKTNQDMAEHIDIDHNSYLSEEEFSDSEGETSTIDGPEGQGKSRENVEDSSLLQILDSWYSSKDDKDNKEESQNVDGPVDCSRNDFKPSDSFGTGSNSISLVTTRGQKTKSRKNYSFVSDTVEDDKEKLIDSILGSLKKSAKSRVEG